MYLYHCLVHRCSSALKVRCSPCRPNRRSTDTPIARHSTPCTVHGRNKNSDIPPSCSVFRSIRWRIDTCHSCIVRARCNEGRIASDCKARRTSLASSRKRCPRSVHEGRNRDRTVLKHNEAGSCKSDWFIREYASVLVSKRHSEAGNKATIVWQVNEAMKGSL